jgi:hypothetical protein
VRTLAEACQKADREETVLSVERIAARVHLGSYQTASRHVPGCMKQEVKGSKNSNKVRPDPFSHDSRLGVILVAYGIRARIG